MEYTQPKKRYSHLLMAITLCLAGTTSLAYAEQAPSEGTREFLSDPGRVGSLTGTILGGALTAHPVGTVVGSILGFFVGKQSMFESPEKQRLSQASYAQRSIIPKTEEKAEETVLASAPEEISPTLETGKSDEILGELATIKEMLKDMAEAKAEEDAQQTQTPAEQIASLCYGNHDNLSDPRLMSICYYHQSSS